MDLIKIKDFIVKHRTKIALITVVILIILYMKQCGQLRYQKKKNKQNTAALTEDVKTYKAKNGELVSEKAVLILSNKELNDLNNDLSKEVNYWKKKKQKVKTITKVRIVYRDTIIFRDSPILPLGDDYYKLSFNHTTKDSLFTFNGISKFKATPFIKNGKEIVKFGPAETQLDFNMNLDLTVGVKEDKEGIDRFFINTNSKDSTLLVEDIRSVQIEKYYKDKYKSKLKKFTVGPYIGVGAGLGNNGQIQLRPQIGLGVQYGLFRF